MKPQTHEILADDDPSLRELLVSYLAGHAQAPVPASAAKADVLLIDLTPSPHAGTRACRILRPRADLSALILKAVESEARAWHAPNAAGGATTLTTPELLAYVRALRGDHDKAAAANEAAMPALARFAGWTLDLAQRRLVGADGSSVTMPPTEFALLVAFLEHPRETLRREQLASRVGNGAGFTTGRTLDVYVGRLRRLLRSGTSGPNVIGTRRNEGYALDADAVFE